METKNYSYLLKNVMQNKFDRGILPEKLWEYSETKKVKKYKMKNVKHWIYAPVWSIKCGSEEYYLSIYQVLLQKNKYQDHIKRINDAKTNYPIIVVEDKYDKYGTILDGNHRFAKLILEKKKKIEVIYLKKKEVKKLMEAL